MQKLIGEFLELRNNTHREHMDLIEKHMTGEVNLRTYRSIDDQLTAKLDVLDAVTRMIIQANERMKIK